MKKMMAFSLVVVFLLSIYANSMLAQKDLVASKSFANSAKAKVLFDGSRLSKKSDMNYYYYTTIKLFETATYESQRASYTMFADKLRENGYEIKEVEVTEQTWNTTKITFNTLAGYDVFVVPWLGAAYSKDEIEAVKKFVENGGGLFIVDRSHNTFAGEFGVDFELDGWLNMEGVPDFKYNERGDTSLGIIDENSKIVTYKPSIIKNFKKGKILLQIDKIPNLYFDKNENGVSDSGETTQFPVTIAVALEYGKGRVIACGDPNFIQNYNLLTEQKERGLGNLRLGLNIIKWLSEPGGPYKHGVEVVPQSSFMYVFDLTHEFSISNDGKVICSFTFITDLLIPYTETQTIARADFPGWGGTSNKVKILSVKDDQGEIFYDLEDDGNTKKLIPKFRRAASYGNPYPVKIDFEYLPAYQYIRIPTPLKEGSIVSFNATIPHWGIYDPTKKVDWEGPQGSVVYRSVTGKILFSNKFFKIKSVTPEPTKRETQGDTDILIFEVPPKKQIIVNLELEVLEPEELKAAKELFDQAKTAFDAQDYQKAKDLFTQAKQKFEKLNDAEMVKQCEDYIKQSEEKMKKTGIEILVAIVGMLVSLGYLKRKK